MTHMLCTTIISFRLSLGKNIYFFKFDILCTTHARILIFFQKLNKFFPGYYIHIEGGSGTVGIIFRRIFFSARLQITNIVLKMTLSKRKLYAMQRCASSDERRPHNNL